MKLTSLVLLLTLCIATDLAYRPFCAWGPATPDPTLLFLLWLAHVDRRGRIYVGLALYTAARVAMGISHPLEAGLPALIGIEIVLLVRDRVQLRDAWVRLLFLSVVAGLTVIVDGWILRRFTPLLLTPALLATALAALWGLFLFPILDACSPLLRNARHPM